MAPEGDRPLAVAGGGQNGHRQAAHSHRVPLVVVPHVPAEEREQLLGAGIGVHIPAIQIHRGLRPFGLELSHSAGVVVVAVGQQDGAGHTAGFRHRGGDPRPIPAGINDGAGLGILVAEEIAVGADGAHLQALDLHGRPPLPNENIRGRRRKSRPPMCGMDKCPVTPQGGSCPRPTGSQRCSQRRRAPRSFRPPPGRCSRR